MNNSIRPEPNINSVISYGKIVTSTDADECRRNSAKLWLNNDLENATNEQLANILSTGLGMIPGIGIIVSTYVLLDMLLATSYKASTSIKAHAEAWAKAHTCLDYGADKVYMNLPYQTFKADYYDDGAVYPTETVDGARLYSGGKYIADTTTIEKDGKSYTYDEFIKKFA